MIFLNICCIYTIDFLIARQYLFTGDNKTDLFNFLNTSSSLDPLQPDNLSGSEGAIKKRKYGKVSWGGGAKEEIHTFLYFFYNGRMTKMLKNV